MRGASGRGAGGGQQGGGGGAPGPGPSGALYGVVAMALSAASETSVLRQTAGQGPSYASIPSNKETFAAVAAPLIVERATNWWMLGMSVLVCMISGPSNFIAYKMLYSAFGAQESLFVATGVNVLYCLIGGSALAVVYSRGKITPAELRVPQGRFAVMGCLDALAGLLAASGAYSTSGPLQQMLNQALIPCTMFCSWLVLGKTSSKLQIFSGVIILFGAAVTLFPSLASSKTTLISALVYASSNVPFSCSFVYKEVAFKGNDRINVILLTQFVSLYQLGLGLLQLPLFGLLQNQSLAQVADQLAAGYDCFLERTASCQQTHAFALLFWYCALNFIYNTSGLFLVKHGSATLNAIVAAVILPLSVLSFSLPFLSADVYEPFQLDTILGLAVVVVGFLLWRRGEMKEEKRATPIDGGHQDAFQERVIVL